MPPELLETQRGVEKLRLIFFHIFYGTLLTVLLLYVYIYFFYLRLALTTEDVLPLPVSVMRHSGKQASRVANHLASGHAPTVANFTFGKFIV